MQKSVELSLIVHVVLKGFIHDLHENHPKNSAYYIGK